jgi:hypothetical protein
MSPGKGKEMLREEEKLLLGGGRWAAAERDGA